MKLQTRKWSRAEIGLFASPLLLLLLFWVFSRSKAPLQRRLAARSLSPSPTNTPAPTPTTPAKIREARFVYQVVPSPDGRSLWTLNKLDGKASIHQYAIEANAWMRVLGDGVEIFPRALQVAPDGRTLVYGWSGNKGEYTEFFDAITGKSRLRLPDGYSTSSVAISPDSRLLVLGFEGHFEIRSLKDGHLLHLIHWQSKKKAEFLSNACFSRDGKFFAVADRNIGIFSTRTWKPVASYCPPHSEVVAFAFVGKNQLAVRSHDKKELNLKSSLWLYNFQSRKTRWLRTLASSGGSHMAVSPDEKFVAISDYRQETGKTVGNTYYSEPGGLIAEIFDVKLGTKIAAGEIEDEEYMTPSIAFSIDSQTLFLGCENAKIRRWPKSNWNLNYPNPL